MYIIGHSVVSYLLIKSIYKLTGHKINGKIIVFSLLFANLPDLFHFDNIRIISHSLLGIFVIGISVIIAFNILGLSGKNEIIVLFVAISTHILTDYSFSSFFFFYPFNNHSYSIYSFNSYEDIIVEIIFSLIFFVVIFKSKDHITIREFFYELRNGVKNSFIKRSIWDSSFISILLYSGYFVFVLLQFFIFFLLNQNRLITYSWFTIFFGLIWIAFIISLIFFLIPIRTQSQIFSSKIK